MKKIKSLLISLCCMLSLITFGACKEVSKELVLSSDKDAALRGETVTFSAVYEGSNGKTYQAEGVVYEIVDGEEFGVLSQNKLTINNTAKSGDKIKVVAKVNNETSNEITVSVSVPLEAITISAGGMTNILPGGFVLLTKTLNPEFSDISKDSVQWVIEEGSSICAISGDMLFVNNQALTGAKIKVKAQAGTVESESLTFTVGYPLEEIEVKVSGSTNVESGELRALNTKLTPSNATDVAITWDFSEGEDLCSIEDNIITVDSDATIGSIIRFRAVCGNIKSDEITIVVGTPIETIVISANGFGSEDVKVLSSNSVILNASVEPTGASLAGLEWKVSEESSEYAEFNSNTLIIKSGTPYGTKIKVHAESGSVLSNELVFQYGVAVSSVEVGSSTLNVVKGNLAILNAVVTPEDATDKKATYEIVEGKQYGSIVENVLSVYQDAQTGAKIKIKATVGGVESTNVVEITVMPTVQEENESKYMLSMPNEIEIDVKKQNQPVLQVDVYNLNLVKVENVDLSYAIVDGNDIVNITPNGNVCSFEVIGHGEATIQVSITGTDVKEEVKVITHLPPEAILLPGVFRERAGYLYNFSKVDFATGEDTSLPFEVSILGDNVCQELKYSFTHEDGSQGDTVATFADGAITFNKTGKVTVVVSSNSGSIEETVATSYTFNINEGINVYTFNQLQALANSSKYNGKSVSYNGEEINIVVLEKPDGSANNYEYGYDLVSPAGLVAKKDQSFELVFNGENSGTANGQRINFVCKSVHINGNNHKIDLSQVRAITKAELSEKFDAGHSLLEWESFYSVLSIIPWSSDESAQLKGNHYAKIYDLEIVGNCSVDYGTNEGEELITATGKIPKVFGTMGTGIAIGSTYQVDTFYNIDLKNVTVSSVQCGICARNVVSGTAEKIHVYDCFANGIEFGASLVKLKDLKFGACGAAGIELVPGLSDEAGLKHDQNQTVVFEGSMDVSENLNDGSTVYFENYHINSYTIPQIVTSLVSNYTETQATHMRNENGEFVFISFVLIDFSSYETNSTDYTYPAFQEGGIIKASELPTDGTIDTTHQYIELDVDLTAFGLGNVGKALLYNHNYGKKV